MIYEYKCPTCKHRFEVALSFPRMGNKRFPKARCPKCKSPGATKVMSYPNIHYKGSGFTLSKDK